jgi:hypothetical protein
MTPANLVFANLVFDYWGILRALMHRFYNAQCAIRLKSVKFVLKFCLIKHT